MAWVISKRKENKMLDPKRIRYQEQEIRQGLLKRRYPLDVLDVFVEKDKKWRNVLQELEGLKHQQHLKTPKGKPSSEELIALKVLSDLIKEKQTLLNELDKEVQDAALYLPNIPDASVPTGDSEADNVEVYKHGVIPDFSFTPLSHDEIGEKLDILDFESSAGF
jgi:seryl-tRNA synthetase